VDALGNPVRIALSPGQTHEMKLAHELLTGIQGALLFGVRCQDLRDRRSSLRRRVVDRAAARAALHERDPIEPNPRGHPSDRHASLPRALSGRALLPAQRCLVEHFFQRIKRYRRIAMRFEKLARNFLAFVYLAAALAAARATGACPASRDVSEGFAAALIWLR
jgi:transposase